MKEQHRLYALELAKGKKSAEACMIAYPKIKDERTASAAAARLNKRQDIKNEVVRLKTEIVSKAESAAIEEIKAEHKFLFLSTGLKRHLLHKIATGKMKTKTWDPKAKEYYFSYPSDDDKIKAMKLDAELTGEGWRPPDPGNAGPVQNNTYIIRKTVFNTRQTTAPVQQVTEIQSGE